MNDARRHHDMGGLDAGSIETEDHDKAPWEKHVDALMRLLSDDERQLIRVNELRRAIEDLGPDVYDRYSYYERWMSAITELMLEKKIIGVSELGERMALIEARERDGCAVANPLFADGAQVRVKAYYPPGHVRTPYYCRGKLGTIERVLGPYPNPERLAYGDQAPEELMLYRVRFAQKTLWADYRGADHDGLELELYEPWLEPA